MIRLPGAFSPALFNAQQQALGLCVSTCEAVCTAVEACKVRMGRVEVMRAPQHPHWPAAALIALSLPMESIQPVIAAMQDTPARGRGVELVEPEVPPRSSLALSRNLGG